MILLKTHFSRNSERKSCSVENVDTWTFRFQQGLLSQRHAFSENDDLTGMGANMPIKQVPLVDLPRAINWDWPNRKLHMTQGTACLSSWRNEEYADLRAFPGRDDEIIVLWRWIAVLTAVRTMVNGQSLVKITLITMSGPAIARDALCKISCVVPWLWMNLEDAIIINECLSVAILQCQSYWRRFSQKQCIVSWTPKNDSEILMGRWKNLTRTSDKDLHIWRTPGYGMSPKERLTHLASGIRHLLFMAAATPRRHIHRSSAMNTPRR